MTRPPLRGEIWLVDFDPSVGAEIRKVRPAVVLSLDYRDKPVYATFSSMT